MVEISVTHFNFQVGTAASPAFLYSLLDELLEGLGGKLAFLGDESVL